MQRARHSHESYRLAWVCPLEVEQIAAVEMLDEEHETLPQDAADKNTYHLGSINGHNVVVAGLSGVGNCSAATVVSQMRTTFRCLQHGLLVGIGGGVPIETDSGIIRLGHVVVSKPGDGHSGVVRYDHGKMINGIFQRTDSLTRPPTVLLNAAQKLGVERARMVEDPIWNDVRRIRTDLPRLQRFKFPGIAKDYLFPSHYIHKVDNMSCERAGCDEELCRKREISGPEESFIVVHRGNLATGEWVIKDATLRDSIANQHNILCFEMEAAGALFDFPCLVIRGIADYCDTHKNLEWHGFAAAAAAAYARQLIIHMPLERNNA